MDPALSHAGAPENTVMKKHILIVDDEEGVRAVLAEALAIGEYRVTAVASAAEAQRAVKADPPDLIISDLQLEDGDGLELIDRLKELAPKARVILLTGVLFDPTVVETTLSKKVSCYIEKTSPLKQILGEIQRLLGA
ncbi:MAG: hypothetical protein A3G75_06915 [Verrucomicrobia bacterium RIFCSPLOWO2_12_FULL_64_8]|nr:MAG: hypothetical protein A3G75_06915 [Verrucomicrobia bacterium RIFCSPLOWO2_12_FULL_64_8]